MPTAVTGGAGFLGSHIVDYFVDQGRDIVVIDDFSSGHEENLSDSLSDVDVRDVDLCDRTAAIDALSDIDVVVHLAAKIGGIGYFHHVPADIISINDAMNRNVLDAAVEHDMDRVCYASSSMVYENATEFPVTEEQLGEIPPPDSAYGFQKLAGEYYCRAYHDQHDVEYSIFRPFNAVGPREPPGEEVGQAHVIPDFVLKINDEKQHPLEILGSGEQIRSFTNVRDIAAGVYKCAYDEAATNDHFNLGSAEAISMLELAELIWERCDREEPFAVERQESFEHDVKKRIPDSTKAKERLGWTPEISLEESLTEYIDWYHQHV
ncbi:NAD-dependent epimerase/dehydratase family protein [Natrarchaeobius chitinivorans]|uniref:NAD-dependent epimerase/dehydratase family protein n=1 Tax=Natrarchaeobius chitinivorans TaxID=1679083 RepID=A0A3N6P7T6_NATCH|nr:NAD-dependent epimerase/dehydratase family protein [Natrarchaeobius chitinivorans]RQG92055.1 NAD-dependent epimerase/dehydratase family protein [Natrarchaeobius chitinivorans]